MKKIFKINAIKFSKIPNVPLKFGKKFKIQSVKPEGVGSIKDFRNFRNFRNFANKNDTFNATKMIKFGKIAKFCTPLKYNFRNYCTFEIKKDKCIDPENKLEKDKCIDPENILEKDKCIDPGNKLEKDKCIDPEKDQIEKDKCIDPEKDQIEKDKCIDPEKDRIEKERTVYSKKKNFIGKIMDYFMQILAIALMALICIPFLAFFMGILSMVITTCIISFFAVVGIGLHFINVVYRTITGKDSDFLRKCMEKIDHIV